MKKAAGLAVMTSVLSLFASGSINIPILKNMPTIDKKYDGEKWANASCASGFISTDGEWAKLQTSTYLAVDEKYLYFAFKCITGKDFKISSQEREVDSEQIFSDESVELFISPDGKSYYHIGINASSSVYSAYCGKERNTSWNPEIEISCGVADTFWFAEGRIALESLGLKSVEGKEFSANFGRNIRDRRQKGSSSWTGQTNFNNPQQFGKLIFSKYAGLDYSLENMSEIILRNNNLNAIEVDYSFGGDKNSVEVKALKASYAKLSTANKTGIVTLEISGAGRSFSKEAIIPYEKKLTINPELYYYPQSKTAIKIVISCLCPNVAVIKMNDMIVSPGKEFEIDLKNAQPGRYVFSAKALDKNNKILAEDKAVIFVFDDSRSSVLPEKQEVKINGKIFMMNGKVFFPFMASNTKDPSPLANDSFNVQYAGHGLRKNAMSRGYCGLGTSIDRKRGVVYEIADDDAVKVNVRKAVEVPAFYKLLQYEAQIPLRRKSTDEMLDGPQKYIEYYKFVKEVSPETLVSIQVDHLDRVGDYMAASDIMEVASTQSSYSKNMIRNLASDVKYAKGTIGNKPLVWWLGASIPNPYVREAESLRAASYIAMMHGANGIIYHMGHSGIPQSMTRLWSLFRGLSREMESLYPIVVSGKNTGAGHIGFDDKNIDFICREFEGNIYMIAVNTAPLSREITFTVNAEKLSVLFENRGLEKKDGKFQDLFTGYEPHVYKLSGK